MRNKKIVVFSLLLLLPLLAGCVNYKQTLKMNEDGSGEAYIHYWFMPESFKDSPENAPPTTEQEIRDKYEKGGVKIENVRTVSRKEKDADGETAVWTHVYFTVLFDQLSQFAQTGIGDVIEGKWSEEDSEYTFKMDIVPSMGVTAMDDYFITFIVDMPNEVLDVSSPGRIDGNQAVWEWNSDEYSMLTDQTVTLTCSCGD